MANKIALEATEKRTNENLIDVCKLIGAFLVIVIHVSPFETVSQTLNFYVENVLARVAVPFYFAASGFLFFRKINFEDGKIQRTQENNRVFYKYVAHISLLYTLWSAIYLVWVIPYWHSIGWTGITVGKDYLLSFFLRGSYYHFWYFVSLIYGVAILYFLLQFVRVKTMGKIAVVLYLIKCYVYGYSWITFPGSESIVHLAKLFNGIFDAVFLAIPCMMMGVLWISGGLFSKENRRELQLACLVSGVLLIAEASALYFCVSEAKAYSYIFFTLPVCYFLFGVIQSAAISNNIPSSIPIRKLSTLIYCLHPLLINLLNLIPEFDSVYSPIRYVVVAIVTFTSSCLLLRMERMGVTVLKYLH